MTYRFKLTQKTHSILIKEVARRKLGGRAEDCDAETREVIHALTGYTYNRVWDADAKGNLKTHPQPTNG